MRVEYFGLFLDAMTTTTPPSAKIPLPRSRRGQDVEDTLCDGGQPE